VDLQQTAFCGYNYPMADKVPDRIREIRTALGLSQISFAKRIYISPALLGAIELRQRNVNSRTIQLITSMLSVNKEWLLTGKGDMFSAPPPDLQLDSLLEIFDQLDQPLRDYLLDQAKGLLKIQQETASKPQ